MVCYMKLLVWAAPKKEEETFLSAWTYQTVFIISNRFTACRRSDSPEHVMSVRMAPPLALVILLMIQGVSCQCVWNGYSPSYMCWSAVPMCCYTCPYPHNQHPTSPYMHPNIGYPPLKPVIYISPSTEIVEGDSVTLICSSNSNPPAEFSWFKGRTFVGSGKIYIISKIRSDHGEEYKCKSRNEYGEKYSDAVALNILYPPRSVSVSISPSGEIVEGDSVTLNCSSDSNPPAEISWYKGETIVGSGGIYSISKISSDHSGEYKCKSRNKHREKYSYPPRNVVVSITGSAEIVEGDSVTLICSSDSNLPALNFSWFKEDESSSVGSGQSFSALQSGRFYCEAHNQHGSQRSDAVTVKG
ncbi:B-cell receptor CD22-like [Labeo rohita]|uniref:B-cell receptor CD22-like n=1 Tax=Labeo rohita TaxID=84645 RepID=UPI0021E3450A|nr:B-cell receptor CD22-like [Labeo rohita]